MLFDILPCQVFHANNEFEVGGKEFPGKHKIVECGIIETYVPSGFATVYLEISLKGVTCFQGPTNKCHCRYPN